MGSIKTMQAQAILLSAALRCITLDYLVADHGYADQDADMEHAGEELALAARNLTEAIAELPPDRRPVGW